MFLAAACLGPALVLGALGAPGCRDSGDPPAPPGGVEAPTSVFRGVELVHQEADGDWWRLSAAEGEGWEGVGTGQLRDVRGEIRRGGQAVTLDAGRGEVGEFDVIRLSDGVEVRWDGYRAEVERADYGRGQGLVTSDAPVLLEGPGLQVRGRGMEVDVEKQRARVKEDVRAWIRGVTP